MSAGARLAAFVGIAVVVFGAALLAGRAVGPVGTSTPAHGMGEMGETAAEPAELPGGLMTSHDGYRFDLSETTLRPGAAVPVAFTIRDPAGEALTTYDVEHDKRLHLIAVRRDFTGFQHVHPTLDGGVWTTELALTPGSWRLFADFKPTGADPLTLGADVAVPGPFTPAPPSPDSRTAHVDGYTVSLAGDLEAGAEAMLTLTVHDARGPVTDLDPYLGAYGHLVVLRAGDLAYLHVHPDGSPGDGSTSPGPDVDFHVTGLEAGRYHLYLDFKRGGVVHTASFTVTVPS
jgi:hypothetical protein